MVNSQSGTLSGHGIDPYLYSREVRSTTFSVSEAGLILCNSGWYGSGISLSIYPPSIMINGSYITPDVHYYNPPTNSLAQFYFSVTQNDSVSISLNVPSVGNSVYNVMACSLVGS